MSEDHTDEVGDEGGGAPVATREDFAVVDVARLFAVHPTADKHEVDRILTEAAKELSDRGGPAARVYKVLLAICSFHLRIENEGEPFGPKLVMDGKRTAIPGDFAGEQSAVLGAVAQSLGHPFLVARAAEVAYENGDRRLGRVAIDAYAELVRRRLDGTFKAELEDIGLRVMDAVRPIERAFQINARVAKRGTVVEGLAEVLELAYRRAQADRAYVQFQRLAVVGMRHRLLDPASVARDAKALASSAGEGDYPIALKDTWALAAEANERAGDADASRAAMLKSIDQTLAMAETMGQQSARAHWIMMAIRELRQLGGCSERVEELRKDLRQAQDRALDEFGQMAMPLDLKEARETTEEAFGEMGLADALRAILWYLQPEPVDKIKQETIDLARKSPLGTLFAASYADSEGKTVAKNEGLGLDDEPSEDWIKARAIDNREVLNHAAISGHLEPARQMIAERFPLQERHFVPIVHFSPFVPPTHRHIFAMGFARLWQGDYVTAGHLLLPQLENSLRHVLLCSGRDSSKIEDDGVQGDRALSMLLTLMKGDLDAIFGSDTVYEIDSLYDFRPGPALRHEFAHGKLGWNSFYNPTVMYGLWFIFFLTAVPLLRRWDDLIAPNVEAML